MDGCLSNCQYKTAFVFDHGHVRNHACMWYENSNQIHYVKRRMQFG